MSILDPELERQLAASAGHTPVEAVVRLRAKPGVAAPPPEETERIARELVGRAQKASGEQEDAINVFKYLGSFAVSAKPAFLKTLLAQPEVESALANRQPDTGMIEPVEKRPARIEDVGREKGTRAPAAPRRSVKKTAARARNRRQTR